MIDIVSLKVKYILILKDAGGGVHNKYRVEPSILLAIFTGRCNMETVDAVLGREKLKENEVLEEIQKMNSFLETVTLESQQAKDVVLLLFL